MGWKSDILQLTLLQKHFQFLHVSIKSGDEASWNLTAVYASPRPDGKKALWQELMKLTTKTDTGWLLGRDFNDIKDKSEKHGGIPPSDKKCALFHERLNDCKLIDLGASGHKFTWRGAIDHVDFSDHHPILVHLYEDQHKPLAKDFKFECSWISESTFKSMMLAAWNSDLGMLQNLEEVQHQAKRWN
ncbi:hypothetical protein KIW84_064415 [Lathyrus oleraceus]|uniref:Uncharacterized protein n=1 Tax=Pisum sativum TaxID=3888 RepID=A0A9D5AB17_PEA|nr:hypothetical protein KIW84_064415 [Pisum sativum]